MSIGTKQVVTSSNTSEFIQQTHIFNHEWGTKCPGCLL